MRAEIVNLKLDERHTADLMVGETGTVWVSVFRGREVVAAKQYQLTVEGTFVAVP